MSISRHFAPAAAAVRLSLLLAAILVAPRADAQERHAISVGFGGGMTVPTGDAKDAFNSGVNGQAFVLVRLGPLPSLRVNIGYQKFDFKQALGAPSGHTDILSGTGGFSMDLIGGPVRPYITAGVGAFDVQSALDAASTGSTSRINFGIDGGAGLAINLGHLSGFVEGHVQNVYTRNGGLVNVKSIQTIPVTFGLLLGL